MFILFNCFYCKGVGDECRIMYLRQEYTENSFHVSLATR